MALDVLNKIKHFEEGGLTGQTQTDYAPSEVAAVGAAMDAGVPVKSGAPVKGGISPAGTTLLNPSQTAQLLANMEKMIAQKTGAWNTFMGGVQDALAYATPQAGGQQAQALQYRNQQKRQEMEDIFGMRQQMATLQASTQQAQAQREAMNQILGVGGAPQQQRPAQGPTQYDVTEGQTPPSVEPSSGVNVPPEIRAAMAMDPVNAPAILQKYLGSAATKRLDAQGNIQGQYFIPALGRSVDMTPNEYLAYQATGKLPGVAPATKAPVTSRAPIGGDVGGLTTRDIGQVESGNRMNIGASPKGALGPMQTMPGTLKSPGYGVAPAQNQTPQEMKRVGDDYFNAMKGKYNNDTLAAIAYNMGPAATDKWVAAGADFNKLPQETKDYIGKAYIANAMATRQPQAPAAAATPRAMNKEEEKLQRELTQKRGEATIEVAATGEKEVSKQEGEKRAEYVKSLSTADQTFNDLDKLLNASKNQKQVFNLAGKGAAGPIAGSALQKLGFADKTDENRNDTIARNLLPEDKQTAYNQIKTGAAVAQANFGKNLVEGAGGKLTNADLALGKIAKGMGTEQTYDSHMFNLAKSMEAARTIYYRSQAFEKWAAQHPNAPISEFETSKEYKTDARIKAAIDVAQKVADVPELAGKFVHRDGEGKPYVVVNGKSYYIGKGQ